MKNYLLSLSTAGALVVMLGGASWAQENPIVAKVNGLEITRADVVEAQKLLPEQYRNIPFEQIFPTLLDSVIDTHLTSADAIKQGMDKQDTFKQEMARIERQLLQRNAITKAIDEAVTDDALKAAYEKMAADASGNSEIHARHILVKTEAEAKAEQE